MPAGEVAAKIDRIFAAINDSFSSGADRAEVLRAAVAAGAVSSITDRKIYALAIYRLFGKGNLVDWAAVDASCGYIRDFCSRGGQEQRNFLRNQRDNYVVDNRLTEAGVAYAMELLQ